MTLKTNITWGGGELTKKYGLGWVGWADVKWGGGGGGGGRKTKNTGGGGVRKMKKIQGVG